ncbi:homocitrate synthase [Arabiibacter massiliensis]|uniref:homocitrate synthase n=1 Tax=Arabiibacter massiliensis TaxID=1870985 RepID=UPI0009BBD6A8|nr:homocitrate synthase [Arabiibacter massiliensis]
MDVQEIVSQLMKSAAEDPSQLKSFGVDPSAAIKNATGLDLNDEEIKDVVAAVEPMLEGEGLNMDKVMEVVGDFLSDGDILGKLGGLFGGK